MNPFIYSKLLTIREDACVTVHQQTKKHTLYFTSWKLYPSGIQEI